MALELSDLLSSSVEQVDEAAFAASPGLLDSAPQLRFPSTDLAATFAHLQACCMVLADC